MQAQQGVYTLACILLGNYLKKAIYMPEFTGLELDKMTTYMEYLEM